MAVDDVKGQLKSFLRWLDKDVAQIDALCFQDAFKMILK